MIKQFNPVLLRTLVAFADTGTLSRAADIVGRTSSAVTAQIQRLEHVAGVPLLEASGRKRVLTYAGERLVGHARRILTANHEAWLSISGTEAKGRVVLGITQDFTGSALPAAVKSFARTHGHMRIDLRVGRSVELFHDFAAGRIDVLVAMRRSIEPDETAIIREPMHWFTATDGLAGVIASPLPIAVLESPCEFRDTALRSLDAAGYPFYIATSSQSLAGLSVAVRAGVAITVRTSRWIQDGIAIAPKELKLPKLPDAEFSIRIHADAADPTRHLADVLVSSLPPLN